MISSKKNYLGNPFRPDWSTPSTHPIYGCWVGATPDGRKSSGVRIALFQKIAQDNGVEIAFIRKIGAFRKDDRISEIISKRGQHPGLVHIFSAMEGCNTYQPWHDKATGRAFLKHDTGKCLHY